MKKLLSNSIVSMIAVSPLWLAACQDSGRRTERFETSQSDIYAARPTQVQGAVVSNRPVDASEVSQLPHGTVGNIRGMYPDAVVLDVERGSADEWVVYAQAGGVIREFHVRGSDGLVLLSDEAMTNQAAINNLPPSVRSAVMSAHPGGIIYAADQLTETDPIAWRVRVLDNGTQYFVDATDTGQLMDQGTVVAGARVENPAYFNQQSTVNAQPVLHVTRQPAQAEYRDQGNWDRNRQNYHDGKDCDDHDHDHDRHDHRD